MEECDPRREFKQTVFSAGLGGLRQALILSLTLVIGAALMPPAQAAFIGDYSANNASLINTNADGFVTAPANGQTIVLTGGNNGSDFPGTTDLLFNATASGLIHFDYSYSSLDLPTYDYAGYLLGSDFTQLADTTGQSGSAMFNVTTGQSFGFRVGTLDNTHEPGILTISNFTAPSGGGSIPEPGTAPVLCIAAGAMLARLRMKHRRRIEE